MEIKNQTLSSLYCLGLSHYIWVTSRRNANTSESQKLILQKQQISLLPQIETWFYCKKGGSKRMLGRKQKQNNNNNKKNGIWFN